MNFCPGELILELLARIGECIKILVKRLYSCYETPSKVEKKPSLSPTVLLVNTSTPDSSTTKKDKKVAMLNVTPTSTQRESKSKRMPGSGKSPGACNLSPVIQSTPTRGAKRTESPGKSPSLLKRNPKGETALHMAVIKVSTKTPSFKLLLGELLSDSLVFFACSCQKNSDVSKSFPDLLQLNCDNI